MRRESIFTEIFCLARGIFHGYFIAYIQIMRDIFRFIVKNSFFFNPLKLNVICRLRQKSSLSSFLFYMLIECDRAFQRHMSTKLTMLTTKVCVIRLCQRHAVRAKAALLKCTRGSNMGWVLGSRGQHSCGILIIRHAHRVISPLLRSFSGLAVEDRLYLGRTLLRCVSPTCIICVLR